MFNTMNTVRPRPYPQRGTGNYNAGNDGLDKDGHNPQGQERQQQERAQTVARGRVEDIQPAPIRDAINSPASNPYSTRQTYPVQTPPPIRIPTHQMNPQQYQAIQGGYQPIPQQQPAAHRWEFQYAALYNRL